VATSGVFKLRAKAAVNVNNAVRPKRPDPQAPDTLGKVAHDPKGTNDAIQGYFNEFHPDLFIRRRGGATVVSLSSCLRGFQSITNP